MIKISIFNLQNISIFSDGTAINQTNSRYIKKFKFFEKDFKNLQLEIKQKIFFKKGNNFKKSNKFNYRKNLLK